MHFYSNFSTFMYNPLLMDNIIPVGENSSGQTDLEQGENLK